MQDKKIISYEIYKNDKLKKILYEIKTLKSLY